MIVQYDPEADEVYVTQRDAPYMVGRYYGSVMPIGGVLYAIALVVSHGNGTVAMVGALIFALIAVTGNLVVGLVRSRTP